MGASGKPKITTYICNDPKCPYAPVKPHGHHVKKAAK